MVMRVEINATLHGRFVFTLFKRNGDGFVLMSRIISFRNVIKIMKKVMAVMF